MLLEIYSKTREHGFEQIDMYVLYWDKSNKKIFEEMGMMFNDGPTWDWAYTTDYRNIKDLIKKCHKDFESVKNLFSEFGVQVTKIGEL